MGNNSVVNYLM